MKYKDGHNFRDLVEEVRLLNEVELKDLKDMASKAGETAKGAVKKAWEGSYAQKGARAVRSGMSSAKDAVKGAAGKASEYASSAKSAVADRASKAGEYAREMGGKAASKAGEAVGKVKELGQSDLGTGHAGAGYVAGAMAALLAGAGAMYMRHLIKKHGSAKAERIMATARKKVNSGHVPAHVKKRAASMRQRRVRKEQAEQELAMMIEEMI